MLHLKLKYLQVSLLEARREAASNLHHRQYGHISARDYTPEMYEGLKAHSARLSAIDQTILDLTEDISVR